MEKQFRHQRLANTLLATMLLMGVAIVILGFGFHLILPVTIAMSLVILLALYLGFYERQW